MKHEGSELVLNNCTSNGGFDGCRASSLAKLTARRVVVTWSKASGFTVGEEASAMLSGCTAANCGRHGVVATRGSRLEMECCRLVQNGEHATFADTGAVV